MSDPPPGARPDPLPHDWDRWRGRFDLGTYDERWARMAAAGRNPHGEADLVEALLGTSEAPAAVLDGGCGTGRVAVELARRGVDVVGVDADPDMIAAARAKAPQLCWVAAGLQDLDAHLPAGTLFDLVVLAGNVIPYVAAADRPAAVAACARRLRGDGLLVAGFSLRPGWPALPDYDRWCADAGLVATDRWATWSRDPYVGGDYAVSAHRIPGTAG